MISWGPISTGSPTECRERPFPHHWARKEDVEAVSNLRQQKNSLRPRWDGVTWHAIFDILFADVQHRRPTFCTAIFQDVEDTVSNYLHSQDVSHPLGIAHMSFASLINHMRDRERSSLRPAQGSHGNQGADLHLGSNYSIPQTAIPQTTQEVFSRPPTGALPAGLDGQGIFPFMSAQVSSEAFGPALEPPFFSGRDFDAYPELGLLEAETTPSYFAEHAPPPAHLPMQDIAGHATYPGFTPQTASQVFNGDPPDTQPTLAGQPTAGPLGQGFGMATFPQTFLPPSDLPPQMYSIARGSQAVAPGVLGGLNQGQWGPYMGGDGAPGPNSQNHRR